MFSDAQPAPAKDYVFISASSVLGMHVEALTDVGLLETSLVIPLLALNVCRVSLSGWNFSCVSDLLLSA
ncbi:hypothetical protein M413DRAFT_113787 [Hebeloma cylindrosporum]|uniref:Uncharacterized protein n=1 Tax=Hebeloma cylindrosporum TaxID=76867 RepID=A0A0C2YIS8_HEBCY|nr:hypothetical protein M413DRAFT_113787 [Hebeloma cylindrosporum h7]